MGYDFYPYYNNDNYYYYSNSFGPARFFSGVLLGFTSLVIIYIIAAWIFRSVGLYHMAKKRGIAHAWFAWIPILSNYVLGRLINDKVVLGDSMVTKHAEFFLPFLTLLSASVSFSGAIGMTISLIIWVYLMSAYWRLYKIYRPKNRVSFTIWSAIIGSGFFIFAIRNDQPFDPLEPNKIYKDNFKQPAATQTSVTAPLEEIKEETITEPEAQLDEVKSESVLDEIQAYFNETIPSDNEELVITLDNTSSEEIPITLELDSANDINVDEELSQYNGIEITPVSEEDIVLPDDFLSNINITEDTEE